jgi:peptide/nickel transport system substrate-binding protein
MSEHGSASGSLTRRDVLKFGVGAGAVLLAGPKLSLGRAISSGTPTRGGTAQLGVTVDIDPAHLFVNDNANFSWYRLVFDTLTELDHHTGKPNPSLAQSWEFTEGGKVVTLNLRSDVKFQSGRPFGPADVVGVINVTKRPGPWQHQFVVIVESILDASVAGSNSVKLRLANPLSNLFDLFELLPMIDLDIPLSDYASGAKVAGTGPFLFKQWTQGEAVTLAKNPNYWKPGLPYLAGVNVRIIPENPPLVAALQSQQVDLIWDVQPSAVLPLKGKSGLRVLTSDVRGVGQMIGSNVKVPPLDQPLVRQAIAWAMDRQRIVNEVYSGVAFANSVPWAPSNPAWSAAAAHHYSYNPAKANALLAKAGVTGAKVQIAYDSEAPANQAVAQIAQFDLSQIGIDAVLSPYDNATIETIESTGKVPGVYVDGHGLGHLHPATLVNGALAYRAVGGNASNFSTPTYTSLAHNALVAATTAQQTSVYTNLTSYLLEQQFVSDLVNFPRVYAQQTRLVGNYYNINDFIVLDGAYLT